MGIVFCFFFVFFFKFRKFVFLVDQLWYVDGEYLTYGRDNVPFSSFGCLLPLLLLHLLHIHNENSPWFIIQPMNERLKIS